MKLQFRLINSNFQKPAGKIKVSTSTVAALFSKTAFDRPKNRYGRYGFPSFYSIFISTVGADGARVCLRRFSFLALWVVVVDISQFPGLGTIPILEKKCSRSEKAILGALGAFRGILGAALGFQKIILGMRNPILGMASHDLRNAKKTILGATPGVIPRIHGNPHGRFSFAHAFSERFFQKLGWSLRARNWVIMKYLKKPLQSHSIILTEFGCCNCNCYFDLGAGCNNLCCFSNSHRAKICVCICIIHNSLIRRTKIQPEFFRHKVFLRPPRVMDVHAFGSRTSAQQTLFS